MAKQKPIDKLLDSTRQVRSGRSLKDSMPAQTYQQMEADLRAVLKAKSEGRVVPSQRRLADFFDEQYGVRINSSTICTWLSKLRGESGKESN